MVLDKKLINFKDSGELSKGSSTSKAKITGAPTFIVKERKMLSSSKNFFSKVNVRKVLQQFWLSIKDVFDTLKVR